MSEKIQRREADKRDERLTAAAQANEQAETAQRRGQLAAARGWAARARAKMAAARLAEILRRADARAEGEQLGEELPPR